MGICNSCFKGQSEETELMPPPEVRRKILEEAAEKRRLENEHRGIKDIEKVRRMQERSMEVERRTLEAERQGGGNPNLRWQTG